MADLGLVRVSNILPVEAAFLLGRAIKVLDL